MGTPVRMFASPVVASVNAGDVEAKEGMFYLFFTMV
jgi:hypothetical protein